jgi:hypothetical protein
MQNYWLTFISNENLFEHVKDTVLKYRFDIDLAKFNENLIDPIKLTFDSKVYQRGIDEVIESEVMRQIDKSNTNHIGYFHQNIFKYFWNWWTVPVQGYDVVNEKQDIFVEMKNKHNTMNSSSSQKTYMRMQNTVITNPKATCYLVEVIAKNSQNITRVNSLDWSRVSHEKIRRASIDKFYELVTWDIFAFRNLCLAIPKVLDDVIKEVWDRISGNTVFEELNEISPNLLKSIYLLSFRKYEWFNSFEI